MLFGAVLLWAPAIVSGCLLLVMGADSGGRPGMVVSWFATALLLQFLSVTNSWPWTAGIVLQTILAIYLAARMKLQR